MSSYHKLWWAGACIGLCSVTIYMQYQPTKTADALASRLAYEQSLREQIDSLQRITDSLYTNYNNAEKTVLFTKLQEEHQRLRQRVDSLEQLLQQPVVKKPP